MSEVAIVDYGINNVRSVRNAVDYCGFNPVVTHDAAVIADASHVILPGVGHLSFVETPEPYIEAVGAFLRESTS